MSQIADKISFRKGRGAGTLRGVLALDQNIIIIGEAGVGGG